MPVSDLDQPQPDPRKASRTGVRRIGWLSRVKGEQIRECTVLDESDTGMRLIVDGPDEIPDTFYLYPTLDFRSRRQVRVAWRSEKQMGVEFLP
jgi:hypothetical protein